MPSGTSSGGTTGAANMPRKKRSPSKALKKGKGGGASGHRMDREMNTPRPGGWANRHYYG